MQRALREPEDEDSVSNRQADQAEEVENRILPFAARFVPAASENVRAPTREQAPVSSLVYADAAGCSKSLTAGLVGLGKNSTLVRTPFGARALLENVDLTVDAAFLSLQDPEVDISSFFGFLKNEHPSVRRIAFAEHVATSEGASARAAAVHACPHDMILWDPWDRSDFDEILKDALDCRVHRTRSSWSDLELFESENGTDAAAIAEIAKRYRHRIVRLVMDVVHDTLDVEDIVQEIYLDIVRHLPGFRSRCSAGYWIDQLSRRAIRAFLSNERRGDAPTLEALLSTDQERELTRLRIARWSQQLERNKA